MCIRCGASRTANLCWECQPTAARWPARERYLKHSDGENKRFLSFFKCLDVYHKLPDSDENQEVAGFRRVPVQMKYLKRAIGCRCGCWREASGRNVSLRQLWIAIRRGRIAHFASVSSRCPSHRAVHILLVWNGLFSPVSVRRWNISSPGEVP